MLQVFTIVAGWVNVIFDWFKARAKAQDDQNKAVSQSQDYHQNDGAQSVTDKQSADAQNAALDQMKKDLDTPKPPKT